MLKRILFLIIFIAPAAFSQQQVWHLDNGQTWSEVSDDSSDGFLLAVSEVKALVSRGRAQKARAAYSDLKEKYPQLAGADYDAFVEAEILYAKREYAKAAKAYSDFLDNYPDSGLYGASLERQHSIATAFLTGEKLTLLKFFRVNAYEQGSEIMRNIADKAGDSPAAKRALSSLARYMEQRGAYEEAYHAWTDVSGRWPTGKMGMDSLYGMARSLSNAYKGPGYDATTLESSKSYYQRFQERYPHEAREIDIEQSLYEIDAALAQKDLEIAGYYQRTGSITAANLYYQGIIDGWPNSSAATIAAERMEELAAGESETE